MSDPLRECPLASCYGPLTSFATEFAEEGLRRAQSIDCFEFVPSNYDVFQACLATMPRGDFCDWGSGIGIGVGLAKMLGFSAVGIEIHEELAEASRQLLADFGLAATIHTGSFFDIPLRSTVYFSYSWPKLIRQVEEYFIEIAPSESRLLIGDGAESIRCLAKASPAA